MALTSITPAVGKSHSPRHSYHGKKKPLRTRTASREPQLPVEQDVLPRMAALTRLGRPANGGDSQVTYGLGVGATTIVGDGEAGAIQGPPPGGVAR